jgi:hypothetical protein
MALSKKEIEALKAELKAQADFQQRLNESAGDYMKLMKDIKLIVESINHAKKSQVEQEQKAKDAVEAYRAELSKGTAANTAILKLLRKQKEVEKAKLKIMNEEIAALEKMTAEMVKQAKEANKVAAAFGMVKNDVQAVNKAVKIGYGKIKNWAGLFDLDKSMKTSALQMGVLSKQTDTFRRGIEDAAGATAMMGIKLDDLAKMQSAYGDELGRNVMLGKEGLIAMGEMAAATGLGADGTAKMAADFEQQGLSAMRTRDYMEQTMNDAHKMGLNASKIVKNISSNIKLLNKYQFKGGVKGLATMAATVTKLGVDMGVVGSMADKLFDVEGAVDMSAQMQVMGGAWSKLADPMKLMYMARNDMEGLTQAMADASKESMTFGKDGSIELKAMEMQRLKKIAEATGVDFEKLVEMGKAQFKIDKARTQIKWDMTKEEKEYMAATASFNEKGEASIMIGLEPKLLSQLNDGDRQILKDQIKEKASLKERADQSQTFDEKLTNLINQFKVLLIPLVDVMDKSLGPLLKDLSKSLADPKVVETIRGTAEKIGKAIAVVGEFIVNNPITSLIAVGLFEAGKWILNGTMLGIGFNTTARVGAGGVGSGMMGAMGQTKGGGFMSNLKGAGASKMLKLGGVATGLLTAYNEYQDNKDSGMATGENVGRTASKGVGAGLGAWGGAASGAAIGTAIFPGIGTAVGALIGGALGAWGGGELGEGAGNMIYGDKKTQALQQANSDDIKLPAPRDKEHGRQILQDNKLYPIHNKDMDLKKWDEDQRKAKANTTATSKSKVVSHKFDRLDGEITINIAGTPGGPGNAPVKFTSEQIKELTEAVHKRTMQTIVGK